MTAPVVQQSIQIKCPHGGSGEFVPFVFQTSAGDLVMRPLDLCFIEGCPFMLPGGVPSPCFMVEWELPALRTTVEGVPALLATSMGICMSILGPPQGAVIVSGIQTRVGGI